MPDKVVYSTDPGWKPDCPACGERDCVCHDPVKRRQPEPLRLSFVRGGKGSGVTRIERLNMHPQGKVELLARFKKRLGCGGAVKEGALEIQGDHRDFLEGELKKEGYKVKRIGG